MKRTGDAKNILVVDDYPMNIELVEVLLASEGYTVSKALSGPEGIAMIRDNAPDLLLLDVRMPGMNGFEMCRQIRNDPSLPFIPVVFITASELDRESMIEGLEAGGNDYIRKPFDRAELIARIHAAIRVKQIYDELARTKTELAHYVSLSTRDMVEKITAGDLAHASRLADVTILFSDIRGFTNISETMRPADVFTMLNYNLSKQIDIITAHQGVIDKLNGDEIMAVFEGDDKERDALQCARAIVECLSKENSEQPKDRNTVGIGINSGPVFIGSLGNDALRDFTVVGNTVNLAARLCGLAGAYQVLFTEATRDAIAGQSIAYESVGKKHLKGLTKPIEIYRLIE